jgi:hypothetical protein
MVHETRIVDADKGIIQVTTEDERFYSRQVDGKTIWIPSVTWICDHYPKGTGFYKWLASKGWDEAEALKEAGGERGRYVHSASNMLLQGKDLDYNTTVDDRELTTEEWACCMSLVDWFEEYKPTVLKTEFTVFSPDNRYAGTLDLFCQINGGPWIVDFKTSADVWPSHRIQVTAYNHALGVPGTKLAIVQLGYKRNKTKKYKVTEVQDDMDLFEAAYTIWQRETSDRSPLQRDYPLKLTLNKEGTL